MIEVIRERLNTRLVTENISLRRAEAMIGVSFSTLSRFLRGEEITAIRAERIQHWLDGTEIPKRRVVSSRRVTVAGQVFVISIEHIGKARS